MEENILIVNKENKLSAISDYLTSCYPNLKLEFFNTSHENLEGNKKEDLCDKDSTVKDNMGIGGEIHLSNEMTVSELENTIKTNLNLNAQVFRKSGKVWLESTTTDSWTLEHQNKRGEEAFK